MSRPAAASPVAGSSASSTPAPRATQPRTRARSRSFTWRRVRLLSAVRDRRDAQPFGGPRSRGRVRAACRHGGGRRRTRRHVGAAREPRTRPAPPRPLSIRPVAPATHRDHSTGQRVRARYRAQERRAGLVGRAGQRHALSGRYVKRQARYVRRPGHRPETYVQRGCVVRRHRVRRCEPWGSPSVLSHVPVVVLPICRVPVSTLVSASPTGSCEGRRLPGGAGPHVTPPGRPGPRLHAAGVPRWSSPWPPWSGSCQPGSR